MRKKYLTNLEREFGYVGNWQPNNPVEVGTWTTVTDGFVPWLKGILGLGIRSIDISKDKSLSAVMCKNLGDIKTKKVKCSPMCISHNVSFELVQGSPIQKITAIEKGGFYLDIQEASVLSADPISLKEKVEVLDEEAIAIVTSVTRVSKGILIVFGQKGASVSLQGTLSSMSEKLCKSPIDLKVSFESHSAAVYQAQPNRPLFPFLTIEIAERPVQHGFSGSLNYNEYTMHEFSYEGFVND